MMVRVLLAPMEGLLDHALRRSLTTLAPYDHAVTEFVRVSQVALPARQFHRICPELRHGSRTEAGTPVRVQLLGSDPVRMAESAARLVTLSPAGIDLNFGCPSTVVNRHGAGALLLDHPERLHRIAASVRAEVPAPMPLTAKMRLGVRDDVLAVDCAQALAAAGIDELVVHARTRDQGYRPPAHWHRIASIAEAVSVPVVANGDIWCVDDWRRCVSESGVPDVMLGRGAVRDPFLAARIRVAARGDVWPVGEQDEWAQVLLALRVFWQDNRVRLLPQQAPGRLKQWLGWLGRRYPAAAMLADSVRRLRWTADCDRVMNDVFEVTSGKAA